MGSQVARGRPGCWSSSWPAATAYAFFQVPYVAMPAEITDSYDERTRLMTWRVAILAFTIMLAGATAPLIRDAVGGRDGYRVMGVVMALVIVVGVVAPTAAPGARPIGAVAAGPRLAARAAAGRRPGARLPAAADHLRGAGAGHGLHARRRRLPGRARCWAAPARPRCCSSASSGRPCCSRRSGPRIGARVGKKRGYVASSLVLAAGAALAVPRRWRRPGSSFAATALVGVGYAGCQVFPMAMLPDAAAVDARRTGENRVGVYTGVWTAGETLGLALGPGRLRAGAGARRLPVLHRRRRRPAGLRPDRDHARLLAAARRADAAQPAGGCARYRLEPTDVDDDATWRRTVT